MTPELRRDVQAATDSSQYLFLGLGLEDAAFSSTLPDSLPERRRTFQAKTEPLLCQVLPSHFSLQILATRLQSISRLAVAFQPAQSDQAPRAQAAWTEVGVKLGVATKHLEPKTVVGRTG